MEIYLRITFFCLILAVVCFIYLKLKDGDESSFATIWRNLVRVHGGEIDENRSDNRIERERRNE